jgi:Trypsin
VGILTDGANSDVVQVFRSTPHPEYNPANDNNDVMLVKLTSPSSAPIKKLNFDHTILANGNSLTVIGFGNTEEGGVFYLFRWIY